MKAYNTCCSQAVPHPGTEQARHWLTSVIGREPVLSVWYGRRQRLGEVGIIFKCEDTVTSAVALPKHYICRRSMGNRRKVYTSAFKPAEGISSFDCRPSTDSLLESWHHPGGQYDRRPTPYGKIGGIPAESTLPLTVDSRPTPYGKIGGISAESTLQLTVVRRPTPYGKVVRIPADSTLPLTVDRPPTPYGEVGIIPAEITLPLTVDRRPTAYGKVVRIPAESTLPLTVDRRPTPYGKIVRIPAESTIPLTVDRRPTPIGKLSESRRTVHYR